MSREYVRAKINKLSDHLVSLMKNKKNYHNIITNSTDNRNNSDNNKGKRNMHNKSDCDLRFGKRNDSSRGHKGNNFIEQQGLKHLQESAHDLPPSGSLRPKKSQTISEVFGPVIFQILLFPFLFVKFCFNRYFDYKLPKSLYLNLFLNFFCNPRRSLVNVMIVSMSMQATKPRKL